MGGACVAYGGGEKGVKGSGGETWGKETIGEAKKQMGGYEGHFINNVHYFFTYAYILF